MKRIVTIWLLVSFLITEGIYSQSLTFKNYSVADGLVANPVRCIYQDSKGFLWIGTFDGLSRYDGFKFTNYTNINGLSHNFINSIIEVKDRLLIAENNGAVDIIRDHSIQKTLKLNSAVNEITPVGGRLILSTDADGIYEYKHDSVILVAHGEINNAFGEILSLNDSLLLVDLVSRKLLIMDKAMRVIVEIPDADILNYRFVRDSKKRIWVCSSEGLRLLNVTTGDRPAIAYAPLPREFDIPPLKNVHVTSMIEETDGSYWIGTWKGLVRLFPDGSYHVYNEREGLPSSLVYTMYRDRERNIWIGTSLGLAKWVSKNHVVFYNTPNDIFKNDVTGAYKLGEKSIILSTYHGLQIFDADSKEFADIQGGGSQFAVPINGTSPLLIHYGNKLGRIDPDAKKIITVQTLDTALTHMNSTAGTIKGTIFLGTLNAFFAVKNGITKKIFPYRITAMAIDKKGILWVGTWNEGLYKLTVKDDPGISYDLEDVTYLVNEKQVRGLYVESNGNIWVGTRYAGAFCLKPGSTGKYETLNINRRSGLMSDWVASFAETGNGDIWVASYVGLDKLVKENSGYRVFNFSRATNFFAEVRKIVPLGNDQWLCAANSGVVYFKDEQLHKIPPLQATILSASMGAQQNKVQVYLPRDKIFLKPHQNSAKFEFSSPGYMNEKGTLYTYRLKGSNDTSWSKPEAIHEASYESLSPGEYTFEVNTIGWNGQHGTPASLSFFISTPFWKQGWFIALCGLLIAALIYWLYRYRVRQIMRVQKVRNTIATDLHDEIGSALTNISILAELSRNKVQEKGFVENLPGRISDESTLAQQALDDIIWSVNSNNDNLDQTMARMRRYAAEVFEPVGIDCRLYFEKIPADVKMNMEQRKDIYLVFKECLNNIIKHAAAKNVHITIDIGKNIFHLVIKDDGKGFEPLQQTNRNGLKNIRSRVQRWHGKLDLFSSSGGGTIVDCCFPLVSPK